MERRKLEEGEGKDGEKVERDGEGERKEKMRIGSRWRERVRKERHQQTLIRKK